MAEEMIQIGQERLTAIAVEIHTIQQTARATVLSAACEIGKRLIEVKNGLPHGAFYNWLEKNVDCSKRQAQNMMSLYEEYGRNGRAQTFADLSVSKAIALLAAPEEVRGDLIESGAAEEMSVRELKAEIERQKEALNGTQQTIADLEKKANDAEALKDVYERDLKNALAGENSAHQAREKAESDARAAKTEAAGLKATLERERTEAADALKAAQDNAPEKIVEIEVVPPEVETELARLREIASKAPTPEVILARGAYERAIAEFEKARAQLDQMDDENRRRYGAAFAAALETMAARMREVAK